MKKNNDYLTKKDFIKAHQETNQRFEKMDQRFEKMDQRFEKMDQNFADLFEVIGVQFQKVDDRLDKVEGRIDKVEARLSDVEQSLQGVRNLIHRHLQISDDRYFEVRKKHELYDYWFTQVARKLKLKLEVPPQLKQCLEI